MRDPAGRRVPERNDIAPGRQNPIQRARGGDQIVAGLGLHQRVNHRVHRRIIDAHMIARTGRAAFRPAPVLALLDARRQGHGPAMHDHVEIIVDQARRMLGAVDKADRGVNAQPLQRFDKHPGALFVGR